MCLAYLYRQKNVNERRIWKKTCKTARRRSRASPCRQSQKCYRWHTVLQNRLISTWNPSTGRLHCHQRMQLILASYNCVIWIRYERESNGRHHGKRYTIVTAFADKDNSKASLLNLIEQSTLKTYVNIVISTIYAFTNIDVSRNEQEGNSFVQSRLFLLGS